MPLRPPAGFIRPGYDPLKVPDAPTGVSASGGDQSASVAFTPPSNVGGSAVSAYYAVSNPDQITATAASSPVTVTGLTNGTPYTFTVWALNTYGPSPYSAASGSVTPSSPYGIFANGNTQGTQIEYVTIATTGNAAFFGTLTDGNQAGAAFGSSTRSIFYTGTTSTYQYINPSSTGNSTYFGAPTVARYAVGGASNDTRGLIFNGDGYINVIEYVTIATVGNAVDFGDTTYKATAVTSVASPTRAVVGGGFYYSGGFQYINYTEYVTIATTGNAVNFGNLTTSNLIFIGGSGSNTRGLFAGGADVYNNYSNVIQYITIASTGNFTDFGDLTFAHSAMGGTSNKTRAIFGGGRIGTGSTVNNIEYVTIATLGNASDFGDLTYARYELSATSSAHGGLA